jgi:protein phosphatase
MKNKFKNITVHTHQGRREYQEDSHAHGDDFVLVDDGVGGLAKGDIASGIVVRTWLDALNSESIRLTTLQKDVQTTVLKNINDLMTYASENPESAGMGSTLACAAWIEDRLVSIHIGDSRVYHFRKDGQIKWRSTDHSLVQELVNGGVITEEEAITHPRRNVITRVLQAKEGQETKASIHVLENIASGDIVMVCSDGINESWSDAGISSGIMGHSEVNDIVAIIGAHSAENSKDNNTIVMAVIEMDVAEQEIAESTSIITQKDDHNIGDHIQEDLAVTTEAEIPLSSNKIEETEAELILDQSNYGIKQKYYRLAIFAIIFMLALILLIQKFAGQ